MLQPKAGPGNVFDNLCALSKAFVSGKSVFLPQKPIELAFLSVPFAWISTAIDEARAKRRMRSFSEFEDICFKADYYCVLHQMLVEVISDGRYSFLLLNTCPIAHVDIKGDVGMALFFDFPPMNEQQWILWEALGASTSHFEVFREGEDVWMSQVKTEEGKLNALTLKRSVNLNTGETYLDVSTPRCTLPMEPDLENLVDWVEVRSGKADVSALLRSGSR
jgi:hypothetical protein